MTCLGAKLGGALPAAAAPYIILDDLTYEQALIPQMFEPVNKFVWQIELCICDK